jgi:DNA/RNA-binding protein KIN17
MRYREFIKDKNHTHISATSWSSLTGFVHFMGRNKIAEVERIHRPNTEWADWWIKYVDRDPKVLKRQVNNTISISLRIFLINFCVFI